MGFLKPNDMKLKTPLLTLTFLVMLLQSCKPKTFNVGYVNLNEVYPKIEKLVQADSIYKIQQKQLENYVAGVNGKFNTTKKLTEAQQELATKYNDTVVAFKKQIEQAYATVVATENHHIQKAIDSVGTMHNYNYVLSTKNNAILFAKDTTHNLTAKVLELLTLKE
jgi:Skp family chaperone for outer membrane proteins